MQRMLVIVAVVILVTVSLGVGSLGAHWPFWQRAWQWHASTTGWPATTTGATAVVHGGAPSLALQYHDEPQLGDVAATGTTHALLRAHVNGEVEAWFAAGYAPRSQVDWRGISSLLLVPLYAQLAGENPGLLDKPAGSMLQVWREDRRGAITPRQFFWQLSGMPEGKWRPLNPFNTRAQLLAGPDFARAALRWQPVWPPGSHFEESAVNAQLLALMAASLDGKSFASLLEQRLWSRAATSDAIAMLDHRRGDMAAHCCVRATIDDWLRLALFIAADGDLGGEKLWEPGFLPEMTAASPVHESQGLGFQLSQSDSGNLTMGIATSGRQLLVAPASGTVLLWVGEGEPPPRLSQLLP